MRENVVPITDETEDRRTDQRQLTLLRVGIIVIGERRELCLIRNISSGGIMAHCHSPLKTNQRIAIELEGNASIPGRVAWIRGTDIGIAFDVPIDVARVLRNEGLREQGMQPRRPRIEVDCAGTLRSGAITHAVRTVDVGQGGVCVSVSAVFAPGDQVVISLPPLRPLAGMVRWCHEGQCGIAFNHILPLHELSGWIKSDA